ncbi:hypothetical protein EKO04_009950 [Ascochyta lentis]|uniref:Uncharacterized protein n=1 Tax=Ascochyta lentis TaxID=205686 RepID=A0A8H7MEK2_9PLEO|nr:hypothetical protein EKO04_009950 [Ascochyta lentis]
MATDITKIWEYPLMNPDEVIDGLEGLIKAMPVLYGPNFIGTNFSPMCCNIRTGDKMERTCFLKGHQSYCCEWIRVDGHRVRCGVRLKVESGGCGTHRAKTMEHSNNLLIKNLIAGKLNSITWEQLNDPLKTAENKAVAAQSRVIDETKEAILAEHNQRIEELDAVGFLPQANPAVYNVHVAFNDNKIQKDRTMAEERRMRAAERRTGAAGKSGLVGKLKNMASNVKGAVTSEQSARQLTGIENERLGTSSYVKSGAKKSNRPDPSVFKNKRGGKNISDLPS